MWVFWVAIGSVAAWTGWLFTHDKFGEDSEDESVPDTEPSPPVTIPKPPAVPSFPDEPVQPIAADILVYHPAKVIRSFQPASKNKRISKVTRVRT